MPFWPFLLVYPPAFFIWLLWRVSKVEGDTVSLWEAFHRYTPDADEELALACFQELYAIGGWARKLRVPLLLSTVLGCCLGLILLLYALVVSVHPAWRFLSFSLVRHLFWFAEFPLLALPLIFLGLDLHFRFRGTPWKQVQQSVLSRHFASLAPLERIRDTKFSGAIPHFRAFLLPYQNFGLSTLAGWFSVTVGTLFLMVLFSFGGTLGHAATALLSLIAIPVLAFVGIAMLRSFWNWPKFPGIPVAVILLHAHEFLGLPGK